MAPRKRDGANVPPTRPDPAEMAVMIILTAISFAANALYTLRCYSLGCQLVSQPLTQRQIKLIYLYVLGVDLLPWFIHTVYDQWHTRRRNFHITETDGAVLAWIALSFTMLALALHVVINLWMIHRFVRSMRTLTKVCVALMVSTQVYMYKCMYT